MRLHGLAARKTPPARSQGQVTGDLALARDRAPGPSTTVSLARIKRNSLARRDVDETGSTTPSEHARVNLSGTKIGAVSLVEPAGRQYFIVEPDSLVTQYNCAIDDVPETKPYSFPALSFNRSRPSRPAQPTVARQVRKHADRRLGSPPRPPAPGADSVERLCYIGARGSGRSSSSRPKGPAVALEDIHIEAFGETCL